MQEKSFIFRRTGVHLYKKFGLSNFVTDNESLSNESQLNALKFDRFNKYTTMNLESTSCKL